MSLEDDLRKAEEARNKSLQEARTRAMKDSLVQELAESLNLYQIAMKNLQAESSRISTSQRELDESLKRMKESESRVVELVVKRITDSAVENLTRQGAIVRQEAAEQTEEIRRFLNHWGWVKVSAIISPILALILAGLLVWLLAWFKPKIEDTRAMVGQTYYVDQVEKRFETQWAKDHP